MAVGVPVVAMVAVLVAVAATFAAPLWLLLLVSFGSCSACYTTAYNVYVLRFDVVTLVNIIRIIEHVLSTKLIC